MKKRRPFRDIAAAIRAQQLAPVDPDALPSVHINWGVDEATGKANPPPSDPETLRAMDELIAAAYKALKEGKLPLPRKALPLPPGLLDQELSEAAAAQMQQLLEQPSTATRPAQDLPKGKLPKATTRNEASDGPA